MDLKPESTLLVSGAAGAVGSALIQIAKNVVGCKRVVGIAGGKEKCDYVKSLGADACVDYKHDNFGEELKEALQGEADFFFDNVGGEVLNEALTVVKRYGFISVCGAISGTFTAFNLVGWLGMARVVRQGKDGTLRGYLRVCWAASLAEG